MSSTKKHKVSPRDDVAPTNQAAHTRLDKCSPVLRLCRDAYITKAPGEMEAKDEFDPTSTTLLSDLLGPLDVGTFLRDCFRQKAVHVSSSSPSRQEDGVFAGRQRVRNIEQNYMHNLDMRSVLRNSSSDNVFVWLAKKRVDEPMTKDGGGFCTVKATEDGPKLTSAGKKSPSLLRSIELSDPDAAYALYSTSGHATYCRAPPELEQLLVSGLLRDTGMGCGQYDPTGERLTVLGRGEVEVFAGTLGHYTDWHTDFQENFTIQLSGIKKWTLRHGVVEHPLRGCTPHYDSPDTVESQIKAARLFNPSFSFSQPDGRTNAYGETAEIVMHPGDVLYFPAGMWHSVETIEAGVSINVSLMAMNYASLVCQSLQHILLREDRRWRECIVNNGEQSTLKRLGALLSDLPAIVEKFSKQGGAEAILPPVLRYPPSFRSANDSDDEEMSAEENSNEPSGSPVDSGSEEEADHIRAPEICGDDTNKDITESHVVDVESFRMPDELDSVRPGDSESYRLVKNPLASLMRWADTTDYHRGGKYGTTPNSSGEDTIGKHRDKVLYADGLYILNVNFAGNESNESMVRVVLKESHNGDEVLRRCAECELKGADPALEFNVGKENGIEDPLACLLYYGYFLWVRVDMCGS